MESSASPPDVCGFGDLTRLLSALVGDLKSEVYSTTTKKVRCQLCVAKSTNYFPTSLLLF